MPITSKSDHAKIDGKIYSLGQAFDTKREAQANAASLRKRGNLCRVTKYYDIERQRTRYGVYVRSKDK